MWAYLTMCVCVSVHSMDQNFIMFNSLTWFRLPIEIQWFASNTDSFWYHSTEMNEILVSIQTVYRQELKTIFWCGKIILLMEKRHTRNLFYFNRIWQNDPLELIEAFHQTDITYIHHTLSWVERKFKKVKQWLEN